MAAQSYRQVLKTWLLALRPWSFTMTAISVSVGALWAADEGINGGLYMLTLLSITALHGAANLSNDYCDVKNNVDTPNAPNVRFRPHPLVMHKLSMRQVLVTAYGLYGLGFGVGLFLIISRGWALLFIGLAGILIGIFYTAKPVAFKYHGLGEIAVFTIWGPLTTSAAYYVQARHFSPSLLVVAMPIGILIALVLLANNLRDATTDKGRNIRTLPVAIGQTRAKQLYVLLLAVAFLSVILMAVFGPLNLWALLVLLALPYAAKLSRMMYKSIPPDADVRTAKLDTVFGILLILAILIKVYHLAG